MKRTLLPLLTLTLLTACGRGPLGEGDESSGETGTTLEDGYLWESFVGLVTLTYDGELLPESYVTYLLDPNTGEPTIWATVCMDQDEHDDLRAAAVEDAGDNWLYEWSVWIEKDNEPHLVNVRDRVHKTTVVRCESLAEEKIKEWVDTQPTLLWNPQLAGDNCIEQMNLPQESWEAGHIINRPGGHTLTDDNVELGTLSDCTL